MRTWLVSLSMLTALGTIAGQSPDPGCTAHTDAKSTAVDSAIVGAMREFSVPGAAVAVVRDSGVAYLMGYGCANIERGAGVDGETLFHVASVSKPFVALAALQLAERGVLDLNTDVNRYLRGMQVPAGWGKPVTLHDLLTHTAGFEESIVGYAARTPADIRPLRDFLAAKLPRRGWAPGDVTAYSNYGYALAGYVVESAARVPFVEYVHNEIFTPLGMTRSTFAQPPPPGLQRDAALSYRCSRNACAPITPDYRSAYPPGGLVTTASDMSRFLLAELGVPVNGKRVISDSELRLMRSRQFSHDPALPGLTYGFAEDELGGARALSHAGGASGYSSFVVLVPEKRFGAFVVTNGGSSSFGAAALEAIRQQLLPDFATDPPANPPRPSGATIDPTGAYRLTRYAHRGVENLPSLFNGQLHVRRIAGDTIAMSGLGKTDGRYVAVGPNRWRSLDSTSLVAVRVQNGEVTHLFGPLSFFGTRFPAAYERLAWYDEPHFVNELLSWAVAIPILSLLAWPVVAAIVWLVRRRTRLVTRIRPTLGAHWRAWAVAAAVLATAVATWFGFGFIAASNRATERGGGEIVYGLPAAMRVLAYAPAALSVLSGILAIAVFLGWRRRWWSIPGLLIFTTVTLSTVLFVAVLVHWGYFPVATG